MKHNGKNIITDQDITLTGRDYEGKTLDTVLTDQEERIDRIESNVKWIYKYGGVGSGSGGGSGSGSSTTTWSAVLYRTDTGASIKDGSTLSLSGKGTYGFKVQIYRGGSDAFRAQFIYQTSKGNRSETANISSDTSFSATRFINLDVNGTLTIMVTNMSEPDAEPITYTITYIVSTYTFNLYYVDATTKARITPEDNTLFMSDIKSTGIMAALDYSISVGIQSAFYTYTDWEGRSVTVGAGEEGSLQERTSKIIYLPLCSDIFSYLSVDANAKFHQFFLDIHLILENQVSEENIPQLSLKDNLVPASLYLRVAASGGTLYTTQQDEEGLSEKDKFVNGTAVFQVTPFHGPYNSYRKYAFQAFLDGVRLTGDDIMTQLADQSKSNIPIPIAEVGWHSIKFTISDNTRTDVPAYSVTYWIFSREPKTNFDYYPSALANPTKIDSYKKMDSTRTIGITGLRAQDSVNMSAVKEGKVTYAFESQEYQNYNTYDQMVCLGIQYLKTNDVDTPIASFNSKTDPRGSIFIYQNKVVICQQDTAISDLSNITGDSCEIYFPTCDVLGESRLDNYHLITIYKRLEKGGVKNNNYWKGIYIYIDGNLEAAFASFTSDHTFYNSVSFYSGNYYVNLIENSCFLHQEDSVGSYLKDIDILGYYYSYKERMLGKEVSEKDKVLYDNFSIFDYTEDNHVITTLDSIAKIAENSDVPVLLLEYTDSENGIGGYRDPGVDNFIQYMDKGYTEEEPIEAAGVAVQWSPGNQELVSIQKDGVKARFSIEPQGSSTKGYRCKNWELYAPSSNDDQTVCLYTPNFDPSDTSTFLPEESFTLKADVVDSSHSNNNAVGRFVNDITTPFALARIGQKNTSGDTTIYADYIKNCLEGFPTLVFLHTTYKEDYAASDANTIDTYYFLGIYNFNLGRKSYHNLGYVNNSIFETINLQSGFGIYEVSRNSYNLLNGLIVAEVQGNSTYFDFSQYNETILFQLESSTNDSTYMFGDIVSGANLITTKTKIKDFVKRTSRAGGYVFDQIGKSYSSSYDDKYGYDEAYSAVDDSGIPKNQVPNYRFQAVRGIDANGKSTYSWSGDNTEATLSDLQDFIITNEEPGAEPRGLNYVSLSEYYTICMALGMVDSVQKNLNIKSWNNGQEFYLSFYDMDTCLGVSNSGSKVSYFAFSDYWDWKNSIDEGIMDQVMVYRDFAPPRKSSEFLGIGSDSFYDTPSSYIFAIAKYANCLLGNDGDLANHPCNLWAKWRRSDGCLANSKKFLETYYKHHLQGVPEAAFNYNYRYKYFVRSAGNGFDTINFPKFSGRKLAYTETWLDDRLHILDAYFNISSVTGGQLVGPNGEEHEAPTVTDTALVDSMNPDIYILHDIFSEPTSTQGVQYSVSAEVNASARAFSPFIYKSANIQKRHMFPNDGSVCTFTFNTGGNQATLFGGSALWTYIESINPFITQQSLQITSNYLTEINGTGGQPCSNWTFNTPSLKSLSLTNPDIGNVLYSGNITFEGQENYPNLKSIKVDGTSIRLNVSNLQISSISALGMKQSANLDVSNTPNLTSVMVSGALGDLSLPGWGENIAIPSDGTFINSTRITVQNDRFPGAEITISNAPYLETLTLSGYSGIIVRNCPKLKKIVIGESEDAENYGLRKIDIECPIVYADSNIQLATSFTIGDETDVVDLSGFTKLEYVRVRNFKTITKVILPDHDLKLMPAAFYECRELETIDGTGKYYITSDDFDSGTSSSGSETFFNACRFTMKTSSGELLKLHVSENNTNLTRTFCIDPNIVAKRGELDLSCVQYILGEGSRETGQNVVAVDEMFRNQKIGYYQEELISEYRNETCSIGFSNFPMCTSFARVYKDAGVYGINRYMFKDIASEVPENIALNLTQVVSTSKNQIIQEYSVSGGLYAAAVIYTTTDFLYEIIHRVTSISLGDNYDVGMCTLCFIDPTTNSVMEVVRLEDVFNPLGRSPEKVTNLENIEFFPGHKLDMSNVFNEHWTAARSDPGIRIWRFMYTETYTSFVEGSLEEFFKNVRLFNINFCMRYLPGYPGAVNLKNFINWEDNLSSIYLQTLFFNDSGSFSLGFNKYVEYSDFQEIWYYILKYMTKPIGCIFNNCTVISSGDISEFLLVDKTRHPDLEPNTNFTKISYLFQGLNYKTSLESSEKKPIPLSHDFFEFMPSITTAVNAFNGMLLKNPIPFDFFRKRYKTTETVYVKKDGEFVEATLTKYLYRKEIENMAGCFSNIQFVDGNRSWYASGEYNKGSVVPWFVKDSEDNTYSEYYTSMDDETLTTNFGPEWEDASEVIDCDIPKREILFGTNVSWINGVITPGMGDGLLCSPDIFYGISQNAIDGAISGCLQYTGGDKSRNTFIMTGVLPRHLVSELPTSVSLSDAISGLNVLPRKLGEIGETSYYYFVPEKFTSRPNLSGAFKFRIIFPERSHKHYMILLPESIPSDVLTLDGALPSTNVLELDRTWAWTSEDSDGISYSVMGNPEYSNETGELVGIEFGFNLSRYTELKLDNLINPTLAALISEKIFTDGGTLVSGWAPKYKLANSTNYVISLTSYGLSKGVKDLWLPATNNHFIYASSQCYISWSSINGQNANTISTKLENFPNMSFEGVIENG